MSADQYQLDMDDAVELDFDLDRLGVVIPNIITTGTKVDAKRDIELILNKVKINVPEKKTWPARVQVVIKYTRLLVEWTTDAMDDYGEHLSDEDKRAWIVAIAMRALEKIEAEVDVVPDKIQGVVFWGIRKTVMYTVTRTMAR